MTRRLTRLLIWVGSLACLTSLTGCSNRPAAPAAPGEHMFTVLQTLAGLSDQCEGDQFHDILQPVAATFPLVDVAGEGKELVWQTFSLNASAAGFDAVRFRSPLSVPADMRWVFSTPKWKFTRWYITPVRGRMTGFGSTDYQYEEKLELDGVELTDENFVFFQALDGGQIKPGEEYVLWFAFHHSEPVQLSLAIRLVEQGRLPESKTSEALARDLGIALPFRHRDVKAVEKLLDDAKVSYNYRHDLMGALRLAEQTRQLRPTHRRTLLYLASLYIARGRQLVEAKRMIDGTDPRANFLIAAGHARLLQQTDKELSEEETAVVRKSFYFAAETHALAGRPDEALSELRDALDAGFDVRDVDMKNFSSLQEVPEFLELIKTEPAAEASTVCE